MSHVRYLTAGQGVLAVPWVWSEKYVLCLAWSQPSLRLLRSLYLEVLPVPDACPSTRFASRGISSSATSVLCRLKCVPLYLPRVCLRVRPRLSVLSYLSRPQTTLLFRPVTTSFPSSFFSPLTSPRFRLRSTSTLVLVRKLGHTTEVSV